MSAYDYANYALLWLNMADYYNCLLILMKNPN